MNSCAIVPITVDFHEPLTRIVAGKSPFKEYFKGELLPGTQYQADAQLTEYLRANAQSMYHLVGTCRIGSGADAVVDHQLRVKGIEGLRVVDASVMPRLPSGNTTAPTIMIAEKAANMILGNESQLTREETV